MNTREALQLVLDHVDYTASACGPAEMVAAVLPSRVLLICHEVLGQNPDMENTLKIIEGMTIEIQERDGRWIAEMPKLPGVMAYGPNKHNAVSTMKRIAFRMLY